MGHAPGARKPGGRRYGRLWCRGQRGRPVLRPPRRPHDRRAEIPRLRGRKGRRRRERGLLFLSQRNIYPLCFPLNTSGSGRDLVSRPCSRYPLAEPRSRSLGLSVLRDHLHGHSRQHSLQRTPRRPRETGCLRLDLHPASGAELGSSLRPVFLGFSRSAGYLRSPSGPDQPTSPSGLSGLLPPHLRGSALPLGNQPEADQGSRTIRRHIYCLEHAQHDNQPGNRADRKLDLRSGP